MIFSVAIVGKANVGKSTLFNALASKKFAIKFDRPGITRDRKEVVVNLFGKKVKLFDTAGLEKVGQDKRFKYESPVSDKQEGFKEAEMHQKMIEQSIKAIELANCVLFVVDCRNGISEEDFYFAKIARQKNKKILLVANKCESMKNVIADQNDLMKFGFGEPVFASAEHRIGFDEILSFIKSHMPEDAEEVRDEPSLNVQITILGRPNVGKSTLMNSILKEERVITGDKAGITRDAIAIETTFAGLDIKLIDTAGVRRNNKKDEIELLSIEETKRSLRLSHIAIVLIDATLPFPKQDIKLACDVANEGRVPIIVINKWDLIDRAVQDEFKKNVEDDAKYLMPLIQKPLFVYISAKTGFGISALGRAINEANLNWNSRVKTAALNKWCEIRLKQNPPPHHNGKAVKVKYITQIKSRPPTFLVFVNVSDGIPESYRRYVANSIAKDFSLHSTPIRVDFTSSGGSNPHVDRATDFAKTKVGGKRKKF